MIDVKSVLAECAKSVDLRISELLSKNDPDYQSLIDSERYSAIKGGKRIRPFISLSVASALGEVSGAALDYACALELIHTYSLIHDDLPSMDNDDYRRGLPTNHKAFGEATAILAGDALIPLAMETVVKSCGSNSDKVLVIKELSEASGAFGMVGGQAMDLAIDYEASLERLIKSHKLKTGALIKCAGRIGVISAGLYYDERILSLCDEYCEKIGLVFQIIDDIFDYYEGKEPLPNSFLAYMSHDSAREYSASLTERAIECANSLDDSGALAEIAKFLLIREK